MSRRPAQSYDDVAQGLIRQAMRHHGAPAEGGQDWTGVLQSVGEVMALRRDGMRVMTFERVAILLRALKQAVRAEHCRLYVIDVSEGGLLCLGDDGQPVGDGERLPMGEGIVGEVMSTGEALYLPDAQFVGHFRAGIDAVGIPNMGALLSVPLAQNGAVVGALHLVNVPGADPARADVKLAGTICEWIVTALAQGTSLLGGTSARVITLPEGLNQSWRLDTLLGRILALALDIVQADRGAIYLYDGTEDELVSRITVGLRNQQIRLPASAGLLGAVFRTGETVTLADVGADARYDRAIERLLGYRARDAVVVPILGSDGRPIGVFEAVNRRSGTFGDDDLRRLLALATQASLAVENWRLYEEVLTVKTTFDTIFRTLPSGVVILDNSGKVKFANLAASRILRVPEDKLEGATVTRLFQGMNQWLLADIDAVNTSREPRSQEGVELVVGDNEWIAVNIAINPLVRDGEDQPMGLMVVMEDVTREQSYRRTVSRYVSDKLVDQLMESGGTDLAGQVQDISVLMSDIRSFTSLTEQQGAQETVAMLNEYFSFMEDVVSNRQGTVDKYIGDALMALFGAPVSTGQDADHAVHAANDMLMVLKMLNTRRSQAGKPPLNIGIGIATGSVITGNIGSSKRTSFTAIGDPVNLSARLESLTKTYGVDVLICGTTKERLKGMVKLRTMDVIRVRGQERPTKIYEVANLRASQLGDAFTTLVDRYEAGLVAYLSGDWERALGLFQRALETVPDDRPSTRMLNRCRRLMADPPPEWDGVWTHS